MTEKYSSGLLDDFSSKRSWKPKTPSPKKVKARSADAQLPSMFAAAAARTPGGKKKPATWLAKPSVLKEDTDKNSPATSLDTSPDASPSEITQAKSIESRRRSPEKINATSFIVPASPSRFKRTVTRSKSPGIHKPRSERQTRTVTAQEKEVDFPAAPDSPSQPCSRVARSSALGKTNSETMSSSPPSKTKIKVKSRSCGALENNRWKQQTRDRLSPVKPIKKESATESEVNTEARAIEKKNEEKRLSRTPSPPAGKSKPSFKGMKHLASSSKTDDKAAEASSTTKPRSGRIKVSPTKKPASPKAGKNTLSASGDDTPPTSRNSSESNTMPNITPKKQALANTGLPSAFARAHKAPIMVTRTKNKAVPVASTSRTKCDFIPAFKPALEASRLQLPPSPAVRAGSLDSSKESQDKQKVPLVSVEKSSSGEPTMMIAFDNAEYNPIDDDELSCSVATSFFGSSSFSPQKQAAVENAKDPSVILSLLSHKEQMELFKTLEALHKSRNAPDVMQRMAGIEE